MIKWTYEACYEEAKKYKTLKEFYDKSESAYRVACKNKWIEEYFWIERKHKQNEYWTYENCFNEALKYKSRSEFCNCNETAYKKSLKNKWINNYYWLEDKRFDLINDKIDCVYAYEFIEQNTVYVGRTLMRLKNRRDLDHIFSNDSVSKFAKENNIPVPEMKILEDNLTIKEGAENEGIWLELYKEDGWKILNIAKTGSIGRIGHRFSKYTYEVCYELAKNCTSRRNFENFNKSAYQVAVKNKWIEDYVWFVRKSKPHGYWNYEHCLEESRKYTSLSEFKKNNNAAYQQARKNNWIEDYYWIKRKYVKKRFWDDYKNCYNEAQKYSCISQFINNSNAAYLHAKDNNWLKDYIWFKRPDVYNKKWTYETTKKEASKYKSKSEFRKNNGSAYTSAWKHGWLDEFFPKSK